MASLILSTATRFVLPLLLIVSCTSEPKADSDPAPSVPLPTMADAAPTEYPGLHNVVAYGDTVVSGSVPHGDQAFKALADMGIKTIISVDGAQPEDELAKKYGIRYVHLPIAYSGIEDERKLELARAVETLDGPIYIHCHHGMHRSAGAAAAATVQLGILSSDQATARMKVSGTSPSYPGLYECALSERVDEATLADIDTSFPERAVVTGMVEAMVASDEICEHLNDIAAAGWKAPADHPDLVPAAEAGRLVDLFRGMGDLRRVKSEPEKFRRMLDVQITTAQAVEDGIVAGLAPSVLGQRWQAALKACQDCHNVYRNQ